MQINANLATNITNAMTNLVYKELSYAIVSVLFTVYNEVGEGYQEKIYQRAIALELKKRKISYQEQKPVSLTFREKKIGQYFIDFVIDGKIVLEIKTARQFYGRDYKQVVGYLKATGLGLGILARFTRDGVVFQRILPGKQKSFREN